jgi:hypothetical protein
MTRNRTDDAQRLEYKMQGNRKVKSNRAGHPDRDAQFQHIKQSTKKVIKEQKPDTFG